VFCRDGSFLELSSDVRVEPFSLHDERSRESWDVAQRDYGSEYWVEVWQVGNGIVTIPFFNIDILSSSKCVGLRILVIENISDSSDWCPHRSEVGILKGNVTII